jgi:D-3-phosphoglycerate dehydrogenase
VDHPVTEEVIEALYKIDGFHLIRSVQLDVPSQNEYDI